MATLLRSFTSNIPYRWFARGGRLRQWMLLATMSFACLGSVAQASDHIVLDQDIDLVKDYGFVHVSQTDGRWARFLMGPNQNKSIGECGCLLSVLGAVMNNTVSGVQPWFPTVLSIPLASLYDFNPRYLDEFFYYGPSIAFTPGWGYKPADLDTCGIIPYIPAWQSLATDGLGHPVGIDPVYIPGPFGPDLKDIVNTNLLAGRPTIVTVRHRDSSQADHAMLIAGWDNTEKTYLYLDPAWPAMTMDGPREPQVMMGTRDNDPPDAEPSYGKFEARIEGIIDIRSGIPELRQGFLFGDEPSPVEILMTGPDGRRTGYDIATGSYYSENDGANYWTIGSWSDPLGEIAVGRQPRFVEYPNAPAGTYDFTVTGTADGPLHLSAETFVGSTRVSLGEFNGTISTGEVRKYELTMPQTGDASVAQVSNFTPHANAGDNLQGRTDTAMTFDGRRSFDADGSIASFAWDFGDGGSGTGAQPQHVYTTPGDYTVTLTVADAYGATATDTMQANVILSQQRPVADLSGPYLGFVGDAIQSRWPVDLYAAKSSDPNGDPLTYHWNYGDGSPIEVTTSPYGRHYYAATGTYTATLVVNDGIDDSLPATAQVEVVAAPGSMPDAVITPSCGLPGDTVTVTMDSFSRIGYGSWNYGMNGDLPAFPPTHLMLGFSAPDGQVRITFLGYLDYDPFYTPFQATLLSPARYSATTTFTVPDVDAGTYNVEWAEEGTLPFQIPCPAPSNHPPIADAGGPYAANTGSSIAFDGSASSDPDGDPLSYEWDFGDGTKAPGVNPVHSYADEGSYIVTLIVNDGKASSTSTTDSHSFARVAVSPAPVEVLRCDVDGDQDIDMNDINAIMAARNTPALGPDDPRDADGNGMIDANDARQCVLQCTKPRCAL